MEGSSTEACLQVSVERAPWTSQTTCGEFGEGSDFSHTWKVHLVDNKDGTFGGVVAFHDCPGGGRARYSLSGEAPPGSATITLKGRRNLALGPLGTKAPATLDFSFTGTDPPSPNLAPRHDLGVALAVRPASVPIGAPVNHVITVVNNGPETATNVLVSATITGARQERCRTGATQREQP